MTTSGVDFIQEMEAIADAFQKGVRLDDRKYMLKTYKNCFVGKEAVDYLVKSGAASNRESAVELGNALQATTHIFEHVTRDHDFKDDHLFYHFVDEKERGSLKIDETTGARMSWSHFLAPVTTKTAATSADGSIEALQPNLKAPDFDALDQKDVHVASRVWPLDEHNTTLLNHVHPPGWQDPIQKKGSKDEEDGIMYYDMVVIGGGAGGLISAAGAAGVGAKVAIIEEHMLGGDCLNVGCVPSKTILHSATLAHTVKGNVKKMEEAGIFVNPNDVKVDFDKVMSRVRKIRTEISHHDSATRYSQELGVEVFIGRGKFTSERTVEVNGKTLHFKRAVVATGGYPTLIPMKGLGELYQQATSVDGDIENRPLVMTNETFFNLTKQPKHMVVIGAGVIGMELGQAMQRLGSQVTILGRSGKVLSKEDEDMADIVKQQLVEDGVKFHLSVQQYAGIKLTGKTSKNGHPEMKLTVLENKKVVDITCDALLISAGRRPNVTGMDLELANVDFDSKLGVTINDKLQTTNPRVYGVGDCCSKFKFTHAADFMARAVVRNALFFGKEKMSSLLIPYATFTSPEIASVGLYAEDLEEKGIEYRIIESHFKDNDRAVCDGNTTGFVRFRVDAKKDTILGASIVGDGAGNMISEVTLAMQSGTGLGSLASVIHPYPTSAEVLRRAGDHYNKTKLTTTVKSLLRGIVKLQK